MAGDLRILHLLSDDLGWETVDHLVSLAAALRELGLPQGLALSRESPAAERARAAGISVFPCEIARSLNPFRWLKLARLLGRFRPAVAHAHGAEAAVLLARALRFGKKTRPAASRYRFHPPPVPAESDPGAAAICPSRAAAERLAGKGEPRIIPAGVALPILARAAGNRSGQRENLRKAHCPDKEKPLFLVNIAPLEEESRHPAVLEAMLPVLAALPQAHLFIMGEGGMEPELLRQVQILALEREVTFFAPAVPDCWDLLAAADLYVSATRGDLAGIMAKAALAAGRAAVLADSGCFPELSGEGKYARLSDPDGGSLAGAMLELLENRNRREQLGRQAGDWARRRFGLAEQATALAAFYAGEGG
ncbi:MAG: glycosyltransferase [Planctomycetota bacterium]|jgi:glycosyltransferase involved in cell wall biosynthesis|nr:glycosyltransferase [Planctomycetota bacterium]